MWTHRVVVRRVGAAVAAAIALTACGASSSNSGSSNAPLVIGAVGALTGPAASYGIDSQDAYTMALDEVNSKGGLLGSKVTMDSEDSKGDPAIGASVAQKFIDNKVVGVVGDVLSTGCLSEGPVLNRANMPWVIALCSNPTLTSHGWKNTFRAVFKDDLQGAFAGDYAYKTLKAKTAVVINDTSAYAQGSGAAFQKAFTAHGGTVLSIEQITPGGKDYTPIVNKVKGENPDLIHFTGFATEGGILAKEARDLKMKSTLFWGAATVDPIFTQIAGPAALGVIVTGSPTPQELPSAAGFVAAFKAKTGREPGSFDHFSYDAMRIMLDAIKRANSTDHAAIISALAKTDFSGASGTITFDGNGDRTNVPFNVSTYDPSLKLVAYNP